MLMFTPEQLALEARPLSEVAIEALESGNFEKLHSLINQMAVMHRAHCYGFVDWIGRVIGRIHIDEGEKFLNRALKQSASFIMEPYAKDFRAGNEKTVFTELVSLWKYHPEGMITPLNETDDKIEFIISPCDSGGRIGRGKAIDPDSRLYTTDPDGSPMFCRGCQYLQKQFNEICGEKVWDIEKINVLPATCKMTFFKKQTKGERVYDNQEIYEVTRTRCSRALEKINNMDFDIKALLYNHHNEWQPLHDFYNLWITSLLSNIYDKKGTQYFDDLVVETYNKIFEGTYMAFMSMDDVSWLRNMVQLWHYHQARFTVEEEENRFKFILNPCGSGGRLYRGEEGKGGAYRYGSGLLRLMKEPADINFNRKDFPIYCTHCASTNREQFEGKPWAFVIDGHFQKTPDSPCIQYFYKKGSKREMDSSMLAQVSMSKTGPLEKSFKP